MTKRSFFIVCFALIVLFAVVVWRSGLLSPRTGDRNALAPPDQPADNYGYMAADDGSSPIRDLRPIGADDRIMGGQGQTDLIVYLDLNDDLSRAYYPSLIALLDLYPDDIRLAFRHYFSRSDNDSYQMATWTECAGRFGGESAYYAAYDHFLADHQVFADDEDNRQRFADLSGIAFSELNACLAGPDLSEDMGSFLNEAKSFGVVGSPTTFANSRLLPGVYPLEDFSDSSGLHREGLKTILAEFMEPVSE